MKLPVDPTQSLGALEPKRSAPRVVRLFGFRIKRLKVSNSLYFDREAKKIPVRWFFQLSLGLRAKVRLTHLTQSNVSHGNSCMTRVRSNVRRLPSANSLRVSRFIIGLVQPRSQLRAGGLRDLGNDPEANHGIHIRCFVANSAVAPAAHSGSSAHA